MTRVLRLIAFAIAIAGAVDPAIGVSGASRARVAIVVLEPAAPAARSVRDRLARDLSPSYEIVPAVTSDAAAAIVIGERHPGRPLPDSLQIATVTLPASAQSGARIVRIFAPREVPGATAIHLDVEIEASGVEGQTTDATAVIDGLEVGRASHRWAAAEKRWRASIDAVPVGEPPYLVKVRLKPDTTDTAATDTATVVSGFSRTAADVVVDARRAPFRVEFYDPRPSWAATFVRRALEADARFQVSTLGFTSRGVSVQTAGAVPLGDPRLDAFDVVVAGGLDRLTAADARGLERYMRERGGAVVIVPDQRIEAGAARDFVSGGSGSVRLQPDLVERLLEQPAQLAVTAPAAALLASELLVMRALTPDADVMARVPGAELSPVIVSMARGDGRLLFSGAMDAWRFRATDSAAFDRFWQSAVAGLAMAVPPPIAIDVEPTVLRQAERGDVIVRVRSRDAAAVSAWLDGDQPIRLVPEPEAGVYRGSFVAKNAPGRSTIDVRAAGASSALPGPKRPGRQTASRTLLVRPDVARIAPTAAPSLAMLASSHRGIDVGPERISDLERFLRGAIRESRTRQERHPMRSTWWILPFALCLSAEWWMRRRRGLR